MNYIIKRVLKKIFTQYLYLEDNSLDLDSGVIKLPAGFINHERINHKLKPFRLKVTSSSYKNLVIHVPLIEILSKPIKVSIEVLDISIERLYEEQYNQKEESESENESKGLLKEEKIGEDVSGVTEEGQVDAREKSGYFRNIINRLIYNMEIYMDQINIRMTDHREQEQFRQAFLTISSMSLKNSLIILQANIIKKTLNLALFHIRHSFGQIQIKDLNICLDFNNNKIALIAILGQLQLDVYKVPMRKITRKLSKQMSGKEQKQEKEKGGGSALEVNLLLKVNESRVASKLVQLQIASFETTARKSAGKTQAKILFKHIRLRNRTVSKQSPDLICISYLPLSGQTKIFSQFEDNIIKSSFISFKQDNPEEKGERIEVKLYHLMVGFDCNQLKILLDQLLQYDREVAQFCRSLQKSRSKQNSQQKQGKKEQIKDNSSNLLLSILLYRVMLKAQYQQLQVKTFGTATLHTMPSQQAGPEPTLKLNKKKSSLVRSTAHLELEKPHLKPSLTQRLKLLQFGISIGGYNIFSLDDFEGSYDGVQVVLNGCSLVVEASLKLGKRMKKVKDLADRDLAYYRQKLKHFGYDEQMKEETEQHQGRMPTLPRVYMKINQVLLRLGELITRTVAQPSQSSSKKKKQSLTATEPTFLAILQLQLVSVLFSLLSSKLKLRLDLISYLYSPYNLQRKPLTNELQCSISHHLVTKELSVALKNDLLVLIEDQYMNILYKVVDGESVWCLFRNLTKEGVTFVQETSSCQPIVSQLEQAQSEECIIQDDEGLTHYHSTRIDSHSTHQLLWLNQIDFKLVIGHKRSQYIELQKVSQLQYNSASQLYEQVREVLLEDESESGYVLRLFYNKLGNLTQLVLDYRTHLISYSKEYSINIHGCRHRVEIDDQYAIEGGLRIWQGDWYNQLQELAQDPSNIFFTDQNQLQHSVDTLMANQQFTLYGLSLSKDGERKEKIHSAYMLQNAQKSTLVSYTIMPFLIIQNLLSDEVEVEIVEKKSQEKEVFLLKGGEKRELSCNDKFDYYMKQFIVKLILRAKGSYESDPFYFNTFTMVNQNTQTPIQLRSTEKHNYTKRTVLFQEGLLLKTKLITLKNSLRVVNKADFGFCLRVKAGREGAVEELVIRQKEQQEWTVRLRRETYIEILLVNQGQTKAEFHYGQIREQKVLSFNFCKLDDRFYNLLFKIQSRVVEGVQLIQIQNFVDLVNLCHFVQDVEVESMGAVPLNERKILPLSSTAMSKYNNKLVEVDDLNKIYAQIFLTAKVTDHPLSLTLDGSFLTFEDLIKQSSQQLYISPNRLILTLLKDMNHNKITFYLTDRLYNQKMAYTIFSNPTAQHFLLTDDSEYSHHFIVEEEVRSSPPEKVFIHNRSFSSLINKDNHDILMCDQDQKHLQKIQKKLLERQKIKLVQYQFQGITLYDCLEEEESSSGIKRQLTTKAIEVRIKMFSKIQLTLTLKNLTFRVLENNKLDCLIQDIALKNEQTKDHLLRIPQETYLLFQGKMLKSGHFGLLKNGFIKCKNIIVNIRRQMPYSLINLISNLGQKMGLRVAEEEVLTPRKYREKIKKLNGQIKLRQYIDQLLLLVRNLFIHEIHLSLTIELQNLSFSNVIILPQYELANKFVREKTFKSELVTFYLTNLLAKFPKLSFLMSNFKNPLNTVKLFFNIREAMKEKIDPQPIICFKQEELPDNPFLLSLQRWNAIINYMLPSPELPVKVGEKLLSYIHQNRKYLILTSCHLLWVQEEGFQASKLTELETVRIIKSRVNSEIVMRFKNGDRLVLIEDQKKCLNMLNSISQLLL